VDEIFQYARLPSEFLVHHDRTLAETFDVAVRAVAAHPQLGSDKYFVECYYLDKDLSSFSGFKQAVRASVNSVDDVLIANFSVGLARGGTMRGGHFSVVGDVRLGPEGSSECAIVIVDVLPSKYGRAWQTDAKMLFDAMVDKDDSRSRHSISV
jgi:hypothetical protein